MAQIQFPVPGQDETEEVTGISMGTHGGVESFIVVDAAGHLAVRNKAPEAAKETAAPTSASRGAETGNTSGSGVTGPGSTLPWQSPSVSSTNPAQGQARAPVR